ncbi:MAG: hypothetical protein JWN56_1503 [Sphingobacteriales bacterium]|nr:hypothetical protein [Sphingobacteriales bacterium]
MKISNEIIGIVAGVLTSTSMLPQVYKTIKEKNAENISPFMIIILMIGTGTWIYYGVLRDDIPIIATNAFSTLVSCVMLICKVKFSSK